MTDKTYTTPGGRVYSESDLERWDWEAANGMPGWEFIGKPTPGRPMSIGATKAKNLTVRLDELRRQKVEKAAAARGIKPSELMRELIDALPA